MRIPSRAALCLPFVLGLAATRAAQAADPQATAVLFENVRIFDGTSDRLSAPSNVLVVGNVIQTISTAPIPTPAGVTLTRIAGGGRTLMPGLIDAHTHLMFATVPQAAILTADIGFVHIAAGKAATDMLMRGFTSVRDLGGPIFGLKRAIDTGLVPGPRIWPSGAFISQTGGHGDFRLPTELPARPGDFSYASASAPPPSPTAPTLVRQRTREQLALGASQIKLMAGGGVASSFDPLDVTQYTVAELRAAVEAAENWGTYVTVHAYTPRAVRQAIEAGREVHRPRPAARRGDREADGREGRLVEPAAVRRRRAVGLPGRLAEPEKQLEMFGGTDTAYGARQEVQDPDGVGDRHALRRGGRGDAGRASSPRWSAGTRRPRC